MQLHLLLSSVSLGLYKDAQNYLEGTFMYMNSRISAITTNQTAQLFQIHEL